VEEGRGIILVICVRVHADLKLAEVVYVESANMTSRPVTSCPLPSDCLEEPDCISSCDLRGDFALLLLRSRGEQTVMLIKLSTVVCRTFKISGYRNEVKLIPGHMIVAKTYYPPKEFGVGVWNVDTLVKSESLNLEDEATLFLEVNSYNNVGKLGLQVYASPLQQDLYVIWFSAARHKSLTTLTLKYHLSLDAHTLCCKGRLIWPRKFHSYEISYAGYAGGVSFGTDVAFMVVDIGGLISLKDMGIRGKKNPLTLRMKKEPQSVEIIKTHYFNSRVSAYSGEWMGFISNRIVIRYFE